DCSRDPATYPRVVAGRAAPPLLFGLAPCGVYHALDVTNEAVRSYFNSRRTGTAPFHPYRVTQPEGENPAVYFLWHFPYRRRTCHRGGNPPPTLAVSEHTALRSSDFPLPRPCQSRRSGRQGEAAITRLARAAFMIVSLRGQVKPGAGFGSGSVCCSGAL